MNPLGLIAQRSGVPRRMLSFGPWTAELRGDEIARIAFDGAVLLRAIRAVVRDQDWNTVPVRVMAVQDQSYGLDLELAYEDPTVRMGATLRLALSGQDLQLHLEVRPMAESLCNRIGLVVLHPPEVAGTAVCVSHGDGSVEDGLWPVEISPHQPFADVRGFAWHQDDLGAELTLSGDVFETEDQRNWTDASFKTYSTPLSRPFPVRHRPGDVIRQSVALSVRSTVVITDLVVGRVPPIGTSASLYPPTTATGLTPGVFDTLLVELSGSDEAWTGLLAAASDQARALGCGLDVRMVTERPEVIERMVRSLPSGVVRLAVFDPHSHITTAELWQTLCDLSLDPYIQLVAGTRAHFTELNRRIGDLPENPPAFTFSLTPQMHATEVDHIVDSLAMQPLVAANAVRLAGGRLVHIGPITLARRFNAVATSGPSTPEQDAERGTDPLLHTTLAAAWTLGSVAALSRVRGVASLSYYEAAGPRGLVAEGVITPVGQVLDRLARLRGHDVLETRARDDLTVLAVRNPSGVQVLLGNLTGRPREVVVDVLGTRQLVQLEPWATAELDL